MNTEKLVKKVNKHENKDIPELREQLDNIEIEKASIKKLNEVQNQVNDLVLGAVGDGNNAEIVQARNGYSTLTENINALKESIGSFEEKRQYLLIENYKDGYYYDFYGDVDIAPSIKEIENENYSIYPPIRLFGGMEYYYENLDNELSRIITLDGKTKIGNLQSSNPYIPENDCLLYITIRKNKKDLSMFCNCELPDKYIQGLIYTEIDKLKVPPISASNTDFIDVKRQFITSDNVTDGYYYTRSNATKTEMSDCSIVDKIRVNKGVTYSVSNVYGYFSNIIYDDGEIDSITTSTSVKYSGSFTAKKDGYIYISFKTVNKGNVMFVNDSNVPNAYIEGDYSYNLKEISKIINNRNIVVKKDGTGDFTSIVEAVNYANSLNKNIDIEIYSGEYDLLEELGGQTWIDGITHTGYFAEREGLRPNKGVNLRGRGKVVCRFELPDTVTYLQSQCCSALNLWQSNEVEGIEFIAKNCRYTLHDESDNNQPYLKRVIKNCTFTHLGNAEGLWEWHGAIIGGTSSGSSYEIINTIANSPRLPLSYHNNNNQDPCKFNVDGCIATGNSNETLSIRFGSYGTNHNGNSIAIVKNCITSGLIEKRLETSSSEESFDLYIIGCQKQN